MKITIDGTEYEVKSIYTGGYLPLIELADTDADFYVAESSVKAGEATRKQWMDIKDNDPREFRCIIGDERLVQWACGESDSFGISSFDEFLDIIESVPEEEFGGYDGQELEVNAADEELVEELDFKPTVAYRRN